MRQVSVLFVNMALPQNVYDAAQAVQKAYEVIYETVRRLKGLPDNLSVVLHLLPTLTQSNRYVMYTIDVPKSLH